MSKTTTAGDDGSDDDRRRRARRQRNGESAEPEIAPTPALIADAFNRLAQDHPRVAEVARLRSLSNLPAAEVAKILGISESTVAKEWRFARAWVHRELERAED